MPITPLHLGPGSVVKVLLGERLSLMVFAFSQGLMDIEVIARVAMGMTKIHGFTNTIVGASAILVPSIFLGKPVCEWCLRWWNRNLDPKQLACLSVPERISWVSASVSSAIGVYSHWFLDALMHADAEVLWPMESGNRFISWLSIEALNKLCIVTLVLGFGILIAYRIMKKRV